MSEAREDLADRAEAAGAPSANGELVFEEPREGRVLSMAVCLSDAGALAWDNFRAQLIGEIGEAAQSPCYVQFLNVLQEALVGEGFLSEQEIEQRAKLLAEAPHDHA